MPKTRHRLLLADDHTLVRQSLCALIDSTPDMEVVGEAENGVEALNQALTSSVDLAVLDVVMPKMTGIQVAAAMRRQRAPARVLFLSASKDRRLVREAFECGAVGYVHKSMTSARFLSSCRRALRGETVLYPEELESTFRQAASAEEDDALTTRQEEVLTLIAEGYSGAEIASKLFISPRTVERHRADVLEKLHLKDRVALTRFAIRHGLIDP